MMFVAEEPIDIFIWQEERESVRRRKKTVYPHLDDDPILQEFKLRQN